jgi:Uma2 family endonuclease
MTQMNNTATATKTYTWDDYRTWPDDQRWEIVGGRAFAMSPSPSVRHQEIQMRLSVALFTYLRGKSCRVYTAPIDVKLSDMNVVQPDLVVVCRPEQLKRTHVEGAPALVVEILSESTAVHDRSVKMRVYAMHGVPEVWLVTPYPWMVEVFRLQGGQYQLEATHRRTDALTSPGFPGLTVDLAEVFDFPVEPGEEAQMVREGHPPYGAKGRRLAGKRKTKKPQERAKGAEDKKIVRYIREKTRKKDKIEKSLSAAGGSARGGTRNTEHPA